jgi:plasmid stabilization system protein ParE
VTAVLFTVEARADALGAFEWYEEQRIGLGSVYRAALDAALERIAREPTSFAVQYRDLRRVLIDRFPYAVFYRVYPELVLVVAVVHGRRHPRAWQRRG